MLREQNGQATVELVAILPALLAGGLVVWQLILVGQTAWLTAGAARVSARAHVVGEDAVQAAKSALPAGLDPGVEVDIGDSGVARVRVPIPIVHHGWRSPVKVSASASLEVAR